MGRIKDSLSEDDHDRLQQLADAVAGADDYERWEFEQLQAMADAGTLGAGITQLQEVAQYLESMRECRRNRKDYLLRWILRVVDSMIAHPTRSVAQIVSPWHSGKRPHPLTARGLSWMLMMRRRAYALTAQALREGQGTKEVFDNVAAQMNAEGLRNTKGEPLKGPTIKAWYYQVAKEFDEANTDEF